MKHLQNNRPKPISMNDSESEIHCPCCVDTIKQLCTTNLAYISDLVGWATGQSIKISSHTNNDTIVRKHFMSQALHEKSGSSTNWGSFWPVKHFWTCAMEKEELSSTLLLKSLTASSSFSVSRFNYAQQLKQHYGYLIVSRVDELHQNNWSCSRLPQSKNINKIDYTHQRIFFCLKARTAFAFVCSIL